MVLSVIILLCSINFVSSGKIGVYLDNLAKTDNYTSPVYSVSTELGTKSTDTVLSTVSTVQSIVTKDGNLSAAAIGTELCGVCNRTGCVMPTSACGAQGKTWDKCGCCPTCSIRKEEDVCGSITCTRWKVCVLNIQGIPICRCPSKLSCPRRPVRPLKRLCGTDNNTYKSKCLIRVQECALQRKIRVKHKGPCVKTDKDRKLQEKLKEKLAKKTKKKARKEERRRKRLRRRKYKRMNRMGLRRKRRMN